MMQQSTNIFTYGTLMFPQIMYSIVSKKDYHSETAYLSDYTRKKVKYAGYPGLLAAKGSQIKGVLYHKITKEDLQTLNDYEGGQYREIQVEVKTEDGKMVKALAYLFKNEDDLEDTEWTEEDYRSKYSYRFNSS